jgi:alpha-L-rhamnosidase
MKWNLESLYTIAVMASVALVLGSRAAGQPLAPANPRCEYLVEPLAIEERTPRFTWEVRDPRRGTVQGAYEVHVASTPALAAGDRPDVWSSGKVESAQSVNVEYAGPALEAGKRYFWAVRTWDAAGGKGPWSEAAWFGVGLLSSADWGGAKWIGDRTPAPAVVPAKYGYLSQATESATAEKWVQIDLGAEKEFDAVRLWPARRDTAAEAPPIGFPVRYRIVGAADDALTDRRIVADRTDADQSDAGREPVLISVAPTRARWVRLEATALREQSKGNHSLALAELEVLWGGEVISRGAAVATSDTAVAAEWAPSNLTDGVTSPRGIQGLDALPAPMLRKEFEVAGPVGGVRRAMLYISALGLYEARLNGQRVGDPPPPHELAPEWTDYAARVQYQGYDVTGLVRQGANAIGVMLGDGWYAGRLGMAQGLSEKRWARAIYGRQPRLIAQLVVEMQDGTVQRVVTDGTWRSTLDGPVRSADLLDGEVQDARRRIEGWDMPRFNETSVGAAWALAVVDESIRTVLVTQPNEPIRVLEALKPIGLAQPVPGVFVFDLGQNLAGRCRIRVRGRAGAVVTLRHAEAVTDAGMIYTANLRGAPQVDRYTLAGDPSGEDFEPRFTYHGFRYVEVSGDIEAPKLEDLTGVVVGSSSPIVGSFECSSEQLNRLWRNILWTQHANMMSVPTDCPQRDERLGWTGDILSFAQTAMFQKDMAGFFTKWMQDVRDAQADDGRYADFAPHPYGRNRHFTGVPAWGDAGVFVPWEAYVNYDDKRLLARHFESARRWIDWICEANPDLIWKNQRHNDYNDWLNGDTLVYEGWSRQGGEVPKDIFATAFFARSTLLVAEMARVLGRSKEEAKYRELAERVRAAFAASFIGADGTMPGDTQAGYALALNFDLAPLELRRKQVELMVAGIGRYGDHLSTGFHSSHRAMIELTGAGHNDLAYRLVLDDRFPSWGYSIANGATTIWERWDGHVKGRGFQDPGMNSLNHWALGSVGEWMMRVIVGINPDPAAPGYAHFVLSPRPGEGLTFARGSYRSIRGLIESGWEREGGRVRYAITIPANTTATVRLRAPNAAAVREGGAALGQAEGVSLVREGDGQVVLNVGAGRYEFEVRE